MLPFSQMSDNLLLQGLSFRSSSSPQQFYGGLLSVLRRNADAGGAAVFARAGFNGFLGTLQQHGHHVIGLVGKTYAARSVGTDAETDLALLRVDATGLAAIAMGDSTALRVGAPVLAIGNPFDVGQTVTAGIVSALGRHGLGLNNYEDFIQTDAAINQGNSGGALVDLEGRLIGINTAIFSPDLTEGFVGIGFAIPTSIIERVLPSLMAGERVKRGYLGFVPQQLSDELARDLGLSVTSGIVVRQVIPESPALAAGLRARDVVLSIDDVPAVRVNRVLQRIAEIPPGKTVSVEVLRGQKRVRLSIKASVRPLGSLEKESLPPAYDEESAPEDAPEH